jgi:16S rRNA (cytosine1402-N4)-methyltransferase
MRKNIPPQQPRDDASKEGSLLHVPVLVDDVLTLLDPKEHETYLDLTAGYGGHASRVAHITGWKNTTLVDRDRNAIAELLQFEEQGAQLLHRDFLSAAAELVEAGKTFDMILVDLGVSSPQLDRAERGFSIKHDGPLDMRMDDRQDKTAAHIVNRTSERELIRIIEAYGEERTSVARKLAKAIVRARPLRTTGELVAAIMSTHRGPYQTVHPATRTFQAIRIALNDELGQVEKLMPLLPRLLTKQGRVAIISFHSLEDRIVKRYFAEQAKAGYEAQLDLLTKKAIKGDINDVHNPRSRSAKLRAAVKK